MKHFFVEFVPHTLESDTLYVSVEFATAVHLCACGCGCKVVTPFAPHGGGWTLSYDGESLSLSPSIGNWSFPCRSHYFIRKNQVFWAGDMSQAEILVGREQERKARQVSYRAGQTPINPPVSANTTSTDTVKCNPNTPKQGLFTAFLHQIRKLKERL